jgi:hypothetical protein
MKPQRSHAPPAKSNSTAEYRRRANPRSRRTRQLRTQSKGWTPPPCHRLEGRRRGGAGARNLVAATTSSAAVGRSASVACRRRGGRDGSLDSQGRILLISHRRLPQVASQQEIPWPNRPSCSVVTWPKFLFMAHTAATLC